MLLQLWPVILAGLIFSAHLLRFYGPFPALLSLLFMVLLTIRNAWIRRVWQVYLFFATLVWIRVTVGFVRYRLAAGEPWLRLLIIMGLIVILTIVAIVWFEKKKVKEFYDSAAANKEKPQSP